MREAEPGEVISEESPVEALWDYPRSKIEAETVIARERGDIPAVILRLAGVYDEWGHSPPITQQIARIYESTLESHLFPGDESRGQPFIHLDDAVAVFTVGKSKVSRSISFRAPAFTHITAIILRSYYAHIITLRLPRGDAWTKWPR